MPKANRTSEWSRQVTIKDVAREAGVGLGTASYALNGTGDNRVSTKTRQHILEIARKLHYKANTFGRSLKLQHSQLIGVIVPTVIHEVIPALIQGIEDELTANGYGMLFCTYSNLSELQKKCQTFLNWRVDGIIFNPQSPSDQPWLYDYLEKLSADMPIVGAGGAQQDHFPWVLVDGHSIGVIGTEFLIENGHRKIALICEPDNWRTQGYREVLLKNDLPFREDYIYHDYPNMLIPEKGILAWLDHFPVQERPTAIFCQSDTEAANLLLQAIARGMTLPRDLSILGTDALAVGKLLTPKLSSIFQDHNKQGMEAVRLMLRLLSGGNTDNVLLQPKLIKQDSVWRLG